MKAYFFDLDGTLADSRAGLYPAFRAGLSAIGAAPPSDDGLAAYLGTPLPEIFRLARPGISQRDIDAGIDAFRAEYEIKGLAANALYPGVIPMLDAIGRRGAATWIVTSKPTFHAERVVTTLRLSRYVSGIVGASPAETETKTDLVAQALCKAQAEPDDVLMVGDRHYDIIGARANGVRAVGVLWGYGSRDELAAAGCIYFAESPDGFRRQFVESDIGLRGPARRPAALTP